MYIQSHKLKGPAQFLTEHPMLFPFDTALIVPEFALLPVEFLEQLDSTHQTGLMILTNLPKVLPGDTIYRYYCFGPNFQKTWKQYTLQCILDFELLCNVAMQEWHPITADTISWAFNSVVCQPVNRLVNVMSLSCIVYRSSRRYCVWESLRSNWRFASSITRFSLATCCFNMSGWHCQPHTLLYYTSLLHILNSCWIVVADVIWESRSE